MSFNYLTNSSGFMQIATYVGHLVDGVVGGTFEKLSQQLRQNPACEQMPKSVKRTHRGITRTDFPDERGHFRGARHPHRRGKAPNFSVSNKSNLRVPCTWPRQGTAAHIAEGNWVVSVRLEGKRDKAWRSSESGLITPSGSELSKSVETAPTQPAVGCQHSEQTVKVPSENGGVREVTILRC